MNKTIPIFSFMLLGCFGFGLLESTTFAQGIAPFQGRGIKENHSSAPGWFGSSTEPKATNESSGWWQQGILRPARPSEIEDRPRLFGSLFQRPESQEPSVMQRASERSREMWDRTRGWAADRNEALRTRASETWGALTSGLRPVGGTEPQLKPEPFKNPMRTADKPDTAKSERF